MPTRNVVLTDHQAQLIEALVQSGRYQNVSEVVHEGLRIIESREADESAKLDRLRAAAKVGTDALDRGDFRDFKNAADLTEHLDRIVAHVRTGHKGD